MASLTLRVCYLLENYINDVVIPIGVTCTIIDTWWHVYCVVRDEGLGGLWERVGTVWLGYDAQYQYFLDYAGRI